MTAKMQSRKLWVVVINSLIIIFNRKLGLGIDAAGMTALATLTAMYLTANVTEKHLKVASVESVADEYAAGGTD